MTDLIDGDVTVYSDNTEPSKKRGRPKGSKNKPKHQEEPVLSKEDAAFDALENHMRNNKYSRWLRVELTIADSTATVGARISKEDILAVSELPSGGCVLVMKAHGAQQPLVFNVATPFVEVEEAITTNEW